MERQEANRLENSRLDAQTRQEIQAHRQDLQARIQGVKKRLHAHIEQHETLKEHCALLISLPGIAELSAARLLAEIVDIKRFKTVKQLVAMPGSLLGSDRREHQSMAKRSSAKLGEVSSAHRSPCVRSSHPPMIQQSVRMLRTCANEANQPRWS